MKTSVCHTILLLLSGLVAACSMGPEYVRPDISMPPTWNVSDLSVDNSLWPEQKWWWVFSDPTLGHLVAEALASNPDLGAALSRIAQARAQVRIAGAARYPEIVLAADADRTQKSGALNGGDGSSAAETAVNTRLVAAYELDFWGKNRRTLQGARELKAATQFDRQALALSIAAEVATIYFRLAALEDRLEIVRETIAVEKRTIEIIEKRHRAGMVSGLDSAQARANLAAVQGDVRDLELQRRQTLNALSLLLGRNPGTFDIEKKKLLAIGLPPAIPCGIPAALLDRRPDIRAAEARLIAANANIGAAKAAMFPRIDLTVAGGYASSDLVNLLAPESVAYTLAGALLAPVFQGGRLQEEYQRSKAYYQELFFHYRKVILASLGDVENALAAIAQHTAAETFRTAAMSEAGRARDLALIRYRSGKTDYLTVLVAGRVYLNARDRLVLTRLDVLTAHAGLFSALSGGWDAAGE